LAESENGIEILGKERSFHWVCLFVFVVAFTHRAFHVLQIRSAAFFPLKLGDAQSYHEWALRIAGGDWVGDEVFYQAPLYPYFLAVIYFLFGDDPFVLRMLQALLGALSCVFLALAGRRFFSPAAGAIAGGILALYAPAVFFDAMFQKSVLDIFFLCFLLWMLGGLVGRVDPLRCGLAGAALGCLILTRENTLLFAPAILLWLGVVHRANRREAVKGVIAFLLAIATILLPVTARNYTVGGEFQLATSAFGSVFYIGNSEDATGDYRSLRPGRGDARYELSDAHLLAEQEVGRALSSSEMSRYWARKAVEYIVNNPGDWLRLMGRNLAIAVSATERVDTEDQYTHADASLPLRWSGYVFNFGLLAPLAVFGVWAAWPQRRRVAILVVLAVIYLLSILLFFVNARYRFPLVPFLILFASVGIAHWRTVVLGSSRRYAAASLLSVAAAAIVVNAQRDSKDAMRAVTEQNIATLLREQGSSAEAKLHYQKSLSYLPSYALAHTGLGLILREQGDNQAAKERFRRAIELDSAYAEPRNHLAMLLLGEGDVEQAIAVFEDALIVRPDYAPLYNNLAKAEFERGRRVEAEELYREALKRDPEYATAHYNLGMLLGLKGERPEAIEHLRAAVRLQPEWQQATDGLASLEH